jgi:NAD(P)-dependent dehydrogenase (short-subunit alcohol dehydrogenase family)
MPLNPRLRDWSGRVVWLVGASSGIGRACAELLHARGAQVVASARSVAALDDLARAHPGLHSAPLDVTDRAALAQAARQIVQRLHRIDLAVYCAGHYEAQRATRFDLPQMLRHNQINYVGALNLLDALLPTLIAQRSGHVSLVSSVAGYRGLPNALAYGPTKAALINLAETLYLDLAPLGIGVSVVNPGFVATPLTAGNAFRMPALITPRQAAEAMLHGWETGRFEIHFPKRFTRWLKLLGHVGDGLYFRVIRQVTRS